MSSSHNVHSREIAIDWLGIVATIVLVVLALVVFLAVAYVTMLASAGVSVFLWPTRFDWCIESDRTLSPSTRHLVRGMSHDDRSLTLLEFSPALREPYFCAPTRSIPTVLIVQGISQPMGASRQRAAENWLRRAITFSHLGYRCLLLQHPCAPWDPDLESRATDLDDAMHFISLHLSDRVSKLVVVGHSAGSLVAAHWVSRSTLVHRTPLVGLVCLNPPFSMQDAIFRCNPLSMFPKFKTWFSETMDPTPMCMRSTLLRITDVHPLLPIIVTYVERDRATEFLTWQHWLCEAGHTSGGTLKGDELRNRQRDPDPHAESPFYDFEDWQTHLDTMFCGPTSHTRTHV